MEGGSNLMKKFVSESELAEVKKKRQEEWEKIRQPNQPLIRPEEPVDHRSLFERLQEQKRDKDAKYDEEHKFGNQIQRLDEDDVQFLSLVNQQQTEMLKQNEKEEQLLVQELMEHRTRQAVQSSKLKINLPSVKVVPGSAKRKRSLADEVDPKKAKASDSINSSSSSAPTNQSETPADKSIDGATPSSTAPAKALLDDQPKANDASDPAKPGTCGQKVGTIEVLGYLPGIGGYVGDGNSSSSDSDSDDEGSLMKCFTKKHFSQKQMIKIMRKGSCS